MIFGWDASDFDWNRGARTSNVKKAKSEGIKFFTHKITEGTKTIHTRAGTMVKAAVDAGIPFVGFYVVPRTPGNNGHGSVAAQVNYAIAQADKQWSGWRKHKGFFWQVDLEHWSYDKVSPKHGNEMAKLLEQKTGKKAVLYAPRWAYGDSIGGSYPLWASNYNGSGSPANFKTQWNRTGKANHAGWQKYSGRKPRILQYSSDATIGGQHTCDANAFDGTEADFAKMINGTAGGGKKTESGSGSGGIWDTIIKKVDPNSGTTSQMRAQSFVAYIHHYAVEQLKKLATLAAGQEAEAVKLQKLEASIQELSDHIERRGNN